jgi:RNA polymerase sigma factor (sigma-70 family)
VDADGTRSDTAAHDEWLVLRCQLGEREAFDRLIARWHPLLWRYAVRLTNDSDTAADVVQEVWLRVLRGLPALRDAARFRAWLFGIARRVLMDRLLDRIAVKSGEILFDPETEISGVRRGCGLPRACRRPRRARAPIQRARQRTSQVVREGTSRSDPVPTKWNGSMSLVHGAFVSARVVDSISSAAAGQPSY